MKTVALFGGSFDPPHIGHIRVVEALKKLSFIDTIVIMPTYLNPFKSAFAAPASLRVAWLQKIFKWDKKVRVSSFEAQKQRQVPTIESVRMLEKEYDTIYLVVGADNLSSLHRWHRYEELQKKVTFIVATRNNIPIQEGFIQLDIEEDTASSGLRNSMDRTKLPPECAQEIEKYYKEHNANKS
jgi:nicotinate-nucleotide adenylyltransferase